MTDRSAVEVIRHIAELALASAESLVADWLPDGRRQGNEWVSRNEARGDRAPGSFGINLDTGRWNDFADSSARGADLVALLAYLRGCRQIEAAREIDQALGLGLLGAPGEPNPEQREQVQRRKRKREETELRRQAAAEEARSDAAVQAVALWRNAKRPDQQHPYLKAKGVKAHHLRQMRGAVLLIPLIYDGKLVNLQTIRPDGAKLFLKGGRVKGCYSPIGDIREGQTLYVCEGWATGATLHEQTGQPVVCAMNANNLTPVAVTMRERFGDSVNLVIAGDDDRQTANNPGRSAANRAAREAGALVVFPEWPDDAPLTLTDFNDLYCWHSGVFAGAQTDD